MFSLAALHRTVLYTHHIILFPVLLFLFLSSALNSTVCSFIHAWSCTSSSYSPSLPWARPIELYLVLFVLLLISLSRTASLLLYLILYLYILPSLIHSWSSIPSRVRLSSQLVYEYLVQLVLLLLSLTPLSRTVLSILADRPQPDDNRLIHSPE